MNYKQILLTVLMMSVMIVPVFAAAQVKPVAPGLGDVQGGGAAGGANDLIGVITRIVNMVLMIVGVIAAVMLIIGGVRYVISQGEEDQTEKAKNTILYALVGLIVIGLAAMIVNFVINAIADAV